MVPVVGLEPTRCRHQRILSPSRLPFHHTGKLLVYYTPLNEKKQEKFFDFLKLFFGCLLTREKAHPIFLGCAF